MEALSDGGFLGAGGWPVYRAGGPLEDRGGGPYSGRGGGPYSGRGGGPYSGRGGGPYSGRGGGPYSGRGGGPYSGRGGGPYSGRGGGPYSGRLSEMIRLQSMKNFPTRFFQPNIPEQSLKDLNQIKNSLEEGQQAIEGKDQKLVESALTQVLPKLSTTSGKDSMNTVPRNAAAKKKKLDTGVSGRHGSQRTKPPTRYRRH